jgi:hypothetical protein
MLLFEETYTVLSISSSRKFANALFSIKNIAINKQLQKQSLDELKNREVWIDLYAASISDRFSNYHYEQLMIMKKTVELTTLENIKEHAIKSIWERIGSNITVPLLDLYVLARMFKKPTGGNISSISFGYFGNSHVKNMVKILSSLHKRLHMNDSKYELVTDINFDESKKSRCLKMPPIDLTDEVNKHNAAI